MTNPEQNPQDRRGVRASWAASLVAIPAAVLVAAGSPQHSDIIVMISGGFKSTYQALKPEIERTTGSTLVTVPGPSMGTTAEAIPNRLARGEPDDVVVMVGYALDELATKGEIVPGTKRVVALSPIGMVVRAGAKVPDIRTVAALRQTLLNASSVAYSDSASGVYLETTLFKRLGIAEQIKGKAHQIRATPVGEIVAQGQAEIGFQEVAELLPVPGVTFVGRLPAEVQRLTPFAAAVTTRSRHPDLARRVVADLASPKARPVLEKMGLEPPAAE
jgi:molybdate transport system substrate-binding protein